MRPLLARPKLGLIAATVAALGVTPSESATVSWVGGTSFWDLVTNWSSNPALPGAADDVLIDVAGVQTVTYRSGTSTVNSLTLGGDDLLAITGGSLTVTNGFSNATTTSLSGGTFTLNGGSSLSALTQSGGVLGGTGTAIVSGPSTWTAGTQTGTGTTRFDGGLSILGNGAKAISGGRTVELHGTTEWNGNTGNNGNSLQFAGGTLRNLGTFNDRNAFASFIDHVSGTNAFQNVGTYNKLSNTVTTVEAVYNNTGVTNVNAGTMLMQGTSTTSSTGVFNIAAGATLEFRNGSHTLDHPTIAGAGTFAVTTDNVGADGIVTLNGGTLTSAFLLSGSTLTGTDRTFQGKAAWTGGALSGTAVTTFANDVAISGPNTKVLVGGGTINLQGTTTWSGNTAANNNAIQFWNGGTINNQGTFVDANAFASFIEHNVGGPHNFNNLGTYNKQANTITTVDIGVAFNNLGVVNVNAGTLRPSGGTSTNSTFNIAPGAVLDFKNGNNTLDNVTTAGAGTLMISTDLVGGDAVVTVNGGTHTTPFVLSGSSLTGSDNTFQGLATWSGGTISGAAATTFTNDVAITGANAKTIFGGRTVNLMGTTTWSGNTAANNGQISFWNGGTLVNQGTFNDANTFASFIEHVVGGPHRFNNVGTYNKLNNTITTVDLGVVFQNSGVLNLNAGTMRFNSGTTGPTGTINVASGATFQHDAPSTVGTMHTAGTLNLGASALTVFTDYDNANFGSGNAFDRRANVIVSGTGPRLVAAADANQGVSGTGVSNGTTTTPTLLIGNVHVGAPTTYAYSIVNTGTTGPALRGAIQDAVNGGNITDPRLSGNGVTAGNWGPLAPGATLTRDVVITTGVAGPLAPFTGQAVAIVNNFENTRSQLLTFGLAPGAAAYRLAEPNTLGPIAFGNVHVGDIVSQALTISNLAPNDGYSEKLDASFGPASDPRITFAGSIGGLAAGQSSTGMTVGLNTAAAGTVNGSIVVNFASNGNGTSGLGITALPSQSVGVTGVIDTVGNVFRLASPSAAAPNPVAFGNVRVGSIATQALTLSNTAPNDGFSEKLNASIGNATTGITASGSFALLAPQATNSTSLVVGLDTSTAGARNGTATITLASDGTGTSGLGITPLTSQTVAVSGAVYRLANPTLLPPSVTLAARVGDAAPGAALTVTNASPDAFTERLNASFGSVSPGFAGSGSITGLAAGASSTALGVTLNTAAAGSFSGSAGVSFVSSGTGTTGAPDQALAGQGVALAGHVYTPAVAQVSPTTLDFGIVHRGDAVAARTVSVTNAASPSALNDTLRGTIATGASGFTATGSVADLAAGATDATSLRVGLDTSAAGTFSGTATASFRSHDAELADLPLDGTVIALTGQVNNYAEVTLLRSGAGTLTRVGDVYTLDFGHVVLGAGDRTADLSVLNSAIGPADLLGGDFDLAGLGNGFDLSGFTPFASLAAGATHGGLQVVFDDDAVGAFSATLVLHATGSNASGFSGRLDDTTLVLRGDVSVAAAIPEPETYALMLGGLMMVVGAGRARRHSRGAARREVAA